MNSDYIDRCWSAGLHSTANSLMATWTCSPKKGFFSSQGFDQFKKCRMVEKSSYWSLSLLTTRLVTFSPRRNRHRRLTDERQDKRRASHQRRSCHFKKDRFDTWERTTDILLAVTHLWKKTSSPTISNSLICFSLICRRGDIFPLLRAFTWKTEEDSLLCLLLAALVSTQPDAVPAKQAMGDILASRVKLDKRHEDEFCCLPFILLPEYQRWARSFQAPGPLHELDIVTRAFTDQTVSGKWVQFKFCFLWVGQGVWWIPEGRQLY